MERELHERFVAAEREVLAQLLERLDVDVPSVEIGGRRYHRVLRSTETYTTAVGTVAARRTLYRCGRERAVVPMELRAGIVERHWTPLAARQPSCVVAQMTPSEGEALLREFGNMAPSKSSLDRLPKGLGARWEANRQAFESTLREATVVPEGAVTVAVSLDGVMVPMKDARRAEKRERSRAAGRRAEGPAGKWLQRNAVIAHRARGHALVRAVGALLSGGKLALTHLERHRAGRAFVKHHIKAVDRLLGNPHLHRERRGVYAALARTVLGGLTRLVILVDWADSALEHKQLILKAAVPVKGRAISIDEEVHPMRRYNSPKIHGRLLQRLNAVLPERCRPIIVTDAGFCGPWCRDVQALRWDWVGRIRNRIKYLKPDTGRWCFIHSLYRQATPRVHHIGWRCLLRRHRYGCRLYLVRAYRCGPGRPRKRRAHRAKYRQLHRTPWLLATSLPHHRGAATRIKRIYAQRMQIEETIRDLKSHRFGFALRYARTKRPERLEALLLVAALATFLLWLLGLAASDRQWTRHFQANTERGRTVLSTVFLGQQMWRNHRFKVTLAELFAALKRLKLLAIQEAQYA